MNIGEKIRTYRRNCKLTQKELGEKIGVSDKTISSWENSRTMPDLKYAVTFTSYFRSAD